MFVKFDCGCVGIINLQGDDEGRPLIVEPCDLGPSEIDHPLDLYRRDMSDKGYEPLPSEEAAELLHELRMLVGQGYQLRTVRWLLRDP